MIVVIIAAAQLLFSFASRIFFCFILVLRTNIIVNNAAHSAAL